MADKIIQFGMFTPADDLCWVFVGKQMLRVAAWLACEWDDELVDYDREGHVRIRGIRRLIHDYGLIKYRAQHEEAQALYNIGQEAKAMFRYFSKPHDRTYYRALLPLEKRALNLERRVMLESPQLKGLKKCEEIARLLNHDERKMRPGLRRYDDFTAIMVYNLLESARDVVVQVYREQRQRLQSRITRILLNSNAA